MNETLRQINEQVEKEGHIIDAMFNELRKVIVGQQYLLERLMIGVLTEGHILLEGVPGLAKTLSVKTLSTIMNIGFKRIQFTPDLLPADLIGTMIYNQKNGEFTPKLGPIFTNMILADEINRAPAKVQSALLEAMEEKQVTIGGKTYPLDTPFIVLATQNPIEQDGTYALPEAQVDRFLLKLNITYPNKEEEKKIVEKMAISGPEPVNQIISKENLQSLKRVASSIYVDDKIKNYIIDIVFASRDPEKYNMPDLKNLIDYGASPRASLAMIKAAKAHAFIKRRGYVIPEDVKAIGKDTLRHRIIPSFEAEAEEMDSNALVDRIFSEIEVP